MMPGVSEELSRLVSLVERLRRDCPWDREQTPETLRTYLLEECHEVLDAIDAQDPDPAQLGTAPHPSRAIR